jgi:hypothetical protein
MKPILIKNIFSESEIQHMLNTIQEELKSRTKIHYKFPTKDKDIDNVVSYFTGYGRIDIKHFILEDSVISKLLKLVKDNCDSTYTDIDFDFVMYSEYTKDSGGIPKLEPHLDVTSHSTLILDYQLKANKSWGIKIDNKIFALEDNDGVLFDPYNEIHSRPVEDFEDGESVAMIFFRFKSSNPLNERDKNLIERLDKENDEFAKELIEQRVRRNNKIRDGV